MSDDAIRPEDETGSERSSAPALVSGRRIDCDLPADLPVLRQEVDLIHHLLADLLPKLFAE
jgi:hypothetical protein